MEISPEHFTTLSSTPDRSLFHSAPLCLYYSRAVPLTNNADDFEFKALQLPPRLQQNASRPSSRSTSPLKSLRSFGRLSLKKDDFDPFEAALERVRKEETIFTDDLPCKRARSVSPLERSYCLIEEKMKAFRPTSNGHAFKKSASGNNTKQSLPHEGTEHERCNKVSTEETKKFEILSSTRALSERYLPQPMHAAAVREESKGDGNNLKSRRKGQHKVASLARGYLACFGFKL